MIQNEVYLEPIKHKYFYRSTGKELTSVSKVLDSLEDPFDVETVSRNCAGKGKYIGMNQDQVKELWRLNSEDACNYGTQIHNALERYNKEFHILEKDAHLTPMIKEVTSTYTDYKQIMDEVCLYHPDYDIAGTTDKLLITGRSIYFDKNNTGKKVPCGIVDIEDYKSNRAKGIYYHSDYNKYMKGPVSHLQQCNYNRYSLQLGIYGVMYERLTGNKVRKLFITYIEEITLKPIRIAVPYLKLEAIAVLEYFHNTKNITILAKDAVLNLEETPNFD